MRVQTYAEGQKTFGFLAYCWLDGEARDNEGRTNFKQTLQVALNVPAMGMRYGKSGTSQGRGTHLDLGTET